MALLVAHVKSDKQLENYLPRFCVNKPLPKVETVRKALSDEEIDKLAEELFKVSTKSSPKAKGKKEQKPLKAPAAAGSSSSSSIPPVLKEEVTLTLYEKTRQTLPHLTQASGSLLQSIIYLEDLNQSLALAPSAFKCVTIWNSAYRFLEQLIRHQAKIDSSVKEHRLLILAQALPSKTEILPLLDSLNGANRWVEYPYEAHYEWARFNGKIPEILNDLMKLFSDSKYVEISPLVDKVMAGCGPLLPQKKHPIENKGTPLPSFHLPFAKLEVPIEELLSKLRNTSIISSKLKEFKKDLRLLNELEDLMQGKVTTQQLPLYTKAMAKLHHALLEHLLQAIYLANHPIELRTHHLQELIQAIQWEEALSPSGKRIKEVYHDLRRISNYPFDTSERESGWHEALVVAEVIRSSPHLLGDGSWEGLITLGGIKIDMSKVTLEPIQKAMHESRELLTSTLPLLYKQLSIKLSS